jgi:hypothetical protein
LTTITGETIDPMMRLEKILPEKRKTPKIERWRAKREEKKKPCPAFLGRTEFSSMETP